MRRSLLVIVTVLAACSGSGQEPAPTTPTTDTADPTTTRATPETTTSTTAPATTTTIGPTTTTTLAPLQSLAYEEVATIEFPVEMTAVAGADISYIATKDGRVLAYDGSTVLQTPVLDIRDQVRNEGERGFLSIALHPDDSSRFFAHYSDNNGDTVISEFTLDSPTEIDPGSEEVLLALDQPASNHNGGMIDVNAGSLYVGLGDGGRSGDAFGNGQNTDTLLGGLVKIGLDDASSDAVLWQYGLRNPWRFWIHGDLIYIADVGQNAFEEINVASLTRDINYGWPITEGLHCYPASSGCDTAGLTLPVIEVGHGDGGTCSITGGIVYRGADIPEIDGHYFYSDFCGGYLRSFVFQDGEVVDQTDWTEQVGVPGGVPGFGVDGRGEMYVMTTERVLKVIPVRDQ